MRDRLASEGLQSHENDDREVDHRGDPHEPPAPRGVEGARPAAREQLEGDDDERKHLQGVHADEVRNAQVTRLRAPAENRNARTAVGESDRVGADDALVVVELLGGLPGHEKREPHAEKAENDTPPDCH